tara:strand:- start:2336 stop:2830 length:495 start_codon:yes stop_codon:yes gene_type:complete
VQDDCLHTGLTGHKDTTLAWWQGQEQTWAQDDKEGCGHDEVVAGQHQTHRAGDQVVEHQKHTGVEKHGGIGCLQGAKGICERVAPWDTVWQLQEQAWAECGKKCCWSKNLWARHVEHLQYTTKKITSRACLYIYEKSDTQIHKSREMLHFPLGRDRGMYHRGTP